MQKHAALSIEDRNLASARHLQYFVPDHYSYITVQETHPSGDPATSSFLKDDLVVLCDGLKQLAMRRILEVFLSISHLERAQ